MPLFISREADPEGNLRPLTRESARRIMHAAFAAAGVENDGRLGTHTLRKTWARKVYLNSGKDIMILKAALNHSDVSVTQKYLEADEDEVMAAIQGCDFTRRLSAGAIHKPVGQARGQVKYARDPHCDLPNKGAGQAQTCLRSLEMLREPAGNLESRHRFIES